MRFKTFLDPRRIALSLGAVSLYLAAQSLFTEHLLENVLSPEIDSPLTSVLDLFSVNAEQTIPTWYSTLILFVAAILLAFIAAIKRARRDPYRRHWIGLALVFGYLSMDEGAVIHEIVADPLRAAFDPGGYLAFSWQLAAVPLVIIFILVYLRFLFRLPPRIRYLFLTAGIVYVGGALVVEAISARRWYLDGGVTFPYLAIGTVEELSEMLGIVLFIFALLTYMAEMEYTAELGFSANRQATPSYTNASGAAMPLSHKLLIGGAAALLIGANLVLLSWAYQHQADGPATNAADPFYQTIINRYAGQGVITLQINELMEDENPAAPQFASSLLTLFDDVLVVALPQERTSFAFAGQFLPFDKNMLADVLDQSGKEQFTILDTAALRGIADLASTTSAGGG